MITANMAKIILLEHRDKNLQQALNTLEVSIKHCAKHNKTSSEVRLQNNHGIYKEVKRILKECGYRVKVHKHRYSADEDVIYKISWR